MTALIGAVGGLLGGFVGQGFYQLSDEKWSSMLVLGWTLTGLLIGAAPATFDFLGAVLRHEERRGVRRKLRNGLIGGCIGGLLGGIVSLLMHGMWAGVFKDSDEQSLWSPSATGFVALGACIGLAVALAQIILREAWLRVEAGFRPGRQILLTRPETTIGRAESCDVGLFGDATVEKLHAKISRQGDQWMVSDAGTQTGTLLNGQRLAGPTALHSGDAIQVGGCVLSFGVRAKESAAPPAAVPVAS
jgi:MFS family permease